jgi:hypothetical protein
MARFYRSSLRIEKITADSYHYILKGEFRQIDELVDGPKLLAMLGRESVVDSNGQPLAAAKVFELVDALPIGQGIDLEVVERVG